MKKAAFILATVFAAALSFGETLPIIDAGLSQAIASTNNAYSTTTTNYVSEAAGQLLIGTGTNLSRAVWMSVQSGSTIWHKIAP